MAPVEFTVTGGEGSPLEYVAALTPAHSFVVITDPGGWAQVSHGLVVRGSASTAVSTSVRVLRFAVVDLRHFSSAAELPSISDVPGDLVALHDTRSWDTASVVRALRGLGRPVVLFTAVHTWVSGVDPASVLIGWSAPHVVLAVPVGAGEGRVEDVLWQFCELERRGMARYTALPSPPEPDDRAVTVMVALPGATEGLAGSLRPGADYEVWVRVGAHSVPLPGDLELRAVLSMSGRAVQVESFVLPVDDASPWVSFPVTTPYGAATRWSGFLVIYHGVVPVHLEHVRLPIGGGEPRATVEYQLSRTFADVTPLSSRAASIMTFGSRILVAAGSGVPSWLSHEGAWPRSVLELSGLDPWFGKDFPAYCADLAALALHGAQMYARLFPGRGMAELVRRSARSGRPAGLMMAEASYDPVPWALVYDLPFTDGPYRLCASVGQFGPFGAGGEVPAHCPVPDHSGNVLCPFGFWGLSSVLEQPVGPLVWRVSERARPFEVALLVDPGMDRVPTERFATELMSLVPPESVSSAYVRSSELGQELAHETMDVVLLHGHEGYLDAGEIIRWWREGVWPREHWPERKPLVVGTSPMDKLASVLVQHGAAGVLSPEVEVDQVMAGWVTGMVLARLAAGASAGDAVRQTRWEMLSRGNVLGLAYTLRAGADLRLRTPPS